MMLGKSVKLTSQFKLDYGMMLNLLRVEELKVEVSKAYPSEVHACKT